MIPYEKAPVGSIFNILNNTLMYKTIGEIQDSGGSFKSMEPYPMILSFENRIFHRIRSVVKEGIEK